MAVENLLGTLGALRGGLFVCSWSLSESLSELVSEESVVEILETSFLFGAMFVLEK